MDAPQTTAEAHPPVADPLLGTVLDGKYLIKSRIGAGGMGVVYAAVQQSLGRTVALKVLSPRHSADPRLEQRFRVEARAASLLRSRHTVTVHDFGVTEEGLLYIAMELLDGESLRDMLHRGPVALQDTLLLGAQIAEALVEAHARDPRIIHRDIKPDNVIVRQTPGGEPVATVLDFGVALLASDPRVTSADLVVGTVAYMAPEQATGAAVDDRLDVYALGVTLFEMIVGRTPFKAPSPVGLMHQHVYEPPPLIGTLVSGIPPELDTLILEMMAKRPDERPSSHEVMMRLRAIREALRNVPDFPTNPALDPIPSTRIASVLIGALAVAGVFVLGALVWMHRKPPPPVVDIARAPPTPQLPAIAVPPPPAAPVVTAPVVDDPHGAKKKPPARPSPERRPGSDDQEFLRPFESRP